MSEVSLSKAVRSNLLSLQNTASMMAKTQERLATGNKVNSALDNPTNFFTAASLNSRAGDMSQLLDSMANGIQTLEAADNGLEAITKNLESMQSTLRQARQDKSFQTASYTMDAAPVAGDEISFTGGAVGATAVDVSLVKTEKVSAFAGPVQAANDGQQFTVSDGTNTTADITINTGDTLDAIATKINTATAAAGSDITASVEDGALTLSSNSGAAITVAEGTSAGAAALLAFGADTAVAKTVDELVNEVNNNTSLEDKIRASNDNGKLRIENLSTQELNVDGVSSTGVIDGTSTGAATIGGNEVRAGLADQYNELRDQLDKLADDASFNGVNLLRGDNLKITFNETGTSDLEIQTKGGESINAGNLGLETNMEAVDLDSDAGIDAFISQVKAAIGEVRSQASSFGSSLSIVQNREDFTKNMINTLETGAGNLTLADTNEEAANLLALQTRQQLSSTALSMASQADQAVLRLF
jgi:flagellin